MLDGALTLYDENNTNFNISYKLTGVKNDYFYIGTIDNHSNLPIDRLSLITGSIWGDIDDQVGS